MNGLQCVHLMEYYTATKRNKRLLVVEEQVVTMLSKETRCGRGHNCDSTSVKSTAGKTHPPRPKSEVQFPPPAEGAF